MASNTRNAPVSEGRSMPALPEGYVSITGPDGQTYVVPDFMIPSLHQVFAGYRGRIELDVLRATGSVENRDRDQFEIIGEGTIMSPTIPPSSDRERLAAHADVLALQELLGISYKDAAHRLYMAHMQRMKPNQSMYKAFDNLKASTEKVLGCAYESIKAIDNDVP